MVRVKICGITNIDDARHAVACGADLLGFVFAPTSPRRVTPDIARSIIESLRDGRASTSMVGVFADQPVEVIESVASHCKLDIVQIHDTEHSLHTHDITLPSIAGYRVRGAIPWHEFSGSGAKAILLDTYRRGIAGGTGESWDWQALRDAPCELPIILAGGLTPSNVTRAIAVAVQAGVNLWAVDVSSGVERSPGLKDPDKVRAFIAAAKGATG